MRFYFHLVGPDEVILDPSGVEAADIDEAREAASEIIAEQAADDAFRQAGESWLLRVCDEAGQVLFELPIG